MLIDEAVKLLQQRDFPWFGIIVENTAECLDFLDELESHIPYADKCIAADGPLRDYAFKYGEAAVAVTLSKYRYGYDRWSGYPSVKYMLEFQERGSAVSATVHWVLWNEIRFSKDEIEFVDLL